MYLSLRARFATLFALVAALGLSACGSSNRLQDYRFDEETVAVVAAIPPAPYVFSDTDVNVRLDRPWRSAANIGTALWKGREVDRAQARFDSALTLVDVPERVAAGTLRQTVDVLGYQPVARPADATYVLDLRLADYGLVADSWNAAVGFALEAEMLLVDRASGRVIWKKTVKEREALTDLPGFGPAFGNVATAEMLSGLSVEEMAGALERLADYTASRLAGELRDDFYKSRD
jgi:hypothetical protein